MSTPNRGTNKRSRDEAPDEDAAAEAPDEGAAREQAAAYVRQWKRQRRDDANVAPPLPAVTPAEEATGGLPEALVDLPAVDPMEVLVAQTQRLTLVNRKTTRQTRMTDSDSDSEEEGEEEGAKRRRQMRQTDRLEHAGLVPRLLTVGPVGLHRELVYVDYLKTPFLRLALFAKNHPTYMAVQPIVYLLDHSMQDVAQAIQAMRPEQQRALEAAEREESGMVADPENTLLAQTLVAELAYRVPLGECLRAIKTVLTTDPAVTPILQSLTKQLLEALPASSIPTDPIELLHGLRIQGMLWYAWWTWCRHASHDLPWATAEGSTRRGPRDKSILEALLTEHLVDAPAFIEALGRLVRDFRYPFLEDDGSQLVHALSLGPEHLPPNSTLTYTAYLQQHHAAHANAVRGLGLGLGMSEPERVGQHVFRLAVLCWTVWDGDLPPRTSAASHKLGRVLALFRATLGIGADHDIPTTLESRGSDASLFPLHLLFGHWRGAPRQTPQQTVPLALALGCARRRQFFAVMVRPLLRAAPLATLADIRDTGLFAHALASWNTNDWEETQTRALQARVYCECLFDAEGRLGTQISLSQILSTVLLSGNALAFAEILELFLLPRGPKEEQEQEQDAMVPGEETTPFLTMSDLSPVALAAWRAMLHAPNPTGLAARLNMLTLLGPRLLTLRLGAHGNVVTQWQALLPVLMTPVPHPGGGGGGRQAAFRFGRGDPRLIGTRADYAFFCRIARVLRAPTPPAMAPYMDLELGRGLAFLLAPWSPSGLALLDHTDMGGSQAWFDKALDMAMTFYAKHALPTPLLLLGLWYGTFPESIPSTCEYLRLAVTTDATGHGGDSSLYYVSPDVHMTVRDLFSRAAGHQEALLEAFMQTLLQPRVLSGSPAASSLAMAVLEGTARYMDARAFARVLATFAPSWASANEVLFNNILRWLVTPNPPIDTGVLQVFAAQLDYEHTGRFLQRVVWWLTSSSAQDPAMSTLARDRTALLFQCVTQWVANLSLLAKRLVDTYWAPVVLERPDLVIEFLAPRAPFPDRIIPFTVPDDPRHKDQLMTWIVDVRTFPKLLAHLFVLTGLERRNFLETRYLNYMSVLRRSVVDSPHRARYEVLLELLLRQ